jgi:hypothetical protein
MYTSLENHIRIVQDQKRDLAKMISNRKQIYALPKKPGKRSNRSTARKQAVRQEPLNKAANIGKAI